jgi:hypothetical protein
MRQQTIFKKKDGCLFASTKLGDQLLADPSKQFTNSSQKWTIIYVRVSYKYIANFTSEILQVLCK